MLFKKTYGYWSVLFGITGTLLLLATYLVSPSNPQGTAVVGLMILLAVAIVTLVLGIITSTIAIKKKEGGMKKYVGILLPVFILLFIVLIPILMGLGFMLNENP